MLRAESGSEKVLVTAQAGSIATDEDLALELADNAMNGIELKLKSITGALKAHMAGYEQYDDITLLSVRRA